MARARTGVLYNALKLPFKDPDGQKDPNEQTVIANSEGGEGLSADSDDESNDAKTDEDEGNVSCVSDSHYKQEETSNLLDISSSSSSSTITPALSTILEALINALDRSNKKSDSLSLTYNNLKADLNDFQKQVDVNKLNSSIERFHQTVMKMNTDAVDNTKVFLNIGYDMEVLKRRVG